MAGGMSDDDIIRRRLLIDGEGGNDDKRLNNLTKSFVRWTAMEPEVQNDRNSDVMFQRMQAMIAQCEYTMEKSVNTYEMNKLEQEQYERARNEIEKAQEEAQRKIETCRTGLIRAKAVRRNKQAYDNLAKIIMKEADRKDSMRMLEVVKRDVSELQRQKGELDKKLSHRKKQFSVLISSIHELERMLEENDCPDQAAQSEREQTMDTSSPPEATKSIMDPKDKNAAKDTS